MTDPIKVAHRLMDWTCYACEHFRQVHPDKEGLGLCNKHVDWNRWAHDVGCQQFQSLTPHKDPDND